MRSIFKGAAVIGLAVLPAACNRHDTGTTGSAALKGEIIEKIERPGGGVAAVSTRENIDAKTPPRYHVYVQMSQNPAQSVEVLDMDRAAPLRMTWVDPTGLRLQVECGSIYRFSNFANVWSGSDQAHADQIVVMLENSGVCPGS